jgi:hypothetical protein
MMPLDQTKMVRAIQLESKISKGLYTRLGEDVALLKKKITAQVSRSIATGDSFAQTAQQLAGQTRIGYNRAIRIARTEGHRIQCTAADDVAHGARDRGADVLKQWDATLDGKTRESHVAVDGQICELDDRFSNGLKFPGDPAGGAAEVVNCRCAYLQRARWALKEGMNPDTGEVMYTEDEGFTKWNNFSRQLETFDRPEDYGEFKKGFFSPENKKYMNYVQQMEDKYHTRDFQKLLGLMSEQEYKYYSRLLANNPMYNTKVPVKMKGIDDCTTVAEVEALFKEQDWFIHGTGTLEGWRSDEGLSFTGCDVDCAKGVYSAYEQLFDHFPQLKNKLAAPNTETKMARNVYARCTMGFGSGMVQVNPYHFHDVKKLMATYAYDVTQGYHPPGTSGFAIVTHELGHALDDYLSVVHHVAGATGAGRNGFTSNKVRSKILKASGYKVADIGAQVSDYATENPQEFFAECFAEYMCSDNPRKVAVEFGKWLESVMEGVK